MDDESQRQIDAGCRAAQAWLDEHGVGRHESAGEQVWLQALVEADLQARIRPCAFRPDADDAVEDGPAPGPAGEPGIGMKLWRLLSHTNVHGGTKVAVYNEKPVCDNTGKPRKLWMPM